MMINDERLQWWVVHPSTDASENYPWTVVCMSFGVSSFMHFEELVILNALLLDARLYNTLDDYEIEDAEVDLVLGGAESLSVDPW
ncbi:MAG: hypothetical protein ACKPKO_09935, partial [Candidatus Fonsibacter sp.]